MAKGLIRFIINWVVGMNLKCINFMRFLICICENATGSVKVKKSGVKVLRATPAEPKFNTNPPAAENSPDKKRGEDSRNEIKFEEHALIIAVVLLLGFFLILAPSAYKGETADTVELAGIFSGWIVAIVGFYFMRNQAEQSATVAQKVGLGRGLSSADYFEEKYNSSKKNLDSLKELVKRVEGEKELAVQNLEKIKGMYMELAESYKALKG
jgi:hypothetical protein